MNLIIQHVDGTLLTDRPIKAAGVPAVGELVVIRSYTMTKEVTFQHLFVMARSWEIDTWTETTTCIVVVKE
jgi:hypothetical protein